MPLKFWAYIEGSKTGFKKARVALSLINLKKIKEKSAKWVL